MNQCTNCGQWNKGTFCSCGVAPEKPREFFKPTDYSKSAPMPQKVKDLISNFRTQPPSKEWAYRNIREYEAGTFPHYCSYKLSCEAVDPPIAPLKPKEETF